MSTSVTKCNVKRTLKHYLVCKHLCLGRADRYFHRQWCFLTVNTTPAETPRYICWFAVCLRDVVTSVVPFKGSFHFKLFFFVFFFRHLENLPKSRHVSNSLPLQLWISFGDICDQPRSERELLMCRALTKPPMTETCWSWVFCFTELTSCSRLHCSISPPLI